MTGHVADLVSAIIPVHNRPQLLSEAIDSVLAQTYRPIEIIVVDDGSTDDTFRRATEYADANPAIIRVLRQPNQGVGAAREKGRLSARGEFIQYLDSDDVLLPDKFELQVSALRAASAACAAYGRTRYRRKDGSVDLAPAKDNGRIPGEMLPTFLLSRWWDTPTPLYRRTACDAVGPWLPIRNEEDWEYDCRIAALGLPLAYVDAYVAEVRDHAGGRLSRGDALDADRLKQRAVAHAEVLKHAQASTLDGESAPMQRFARELFLLARQCGAAGLAAESRMLLRGAASVARRDRDIQIYAALAALLGWQRLGLFSIRLDRLRSGVQGFRDLRYKRASV